MGGMREKERKKNRIRHARKISTNHPQHKKAYEGAAAAGKEGGRGGSTRCPDMLGTGRTDTGAGVGERDRAKGGADRDTHYQCSSVKYWTLTAACGEVFLW